MSTKNLVSLGLLALAVTTVTAAIAGAAQEDSASTSPKGEKTDRSQNSEDEARAKTPRENDLLQTVREELLAHNIPTDVVAKILENLRQKREATKLNRFESVSVLNEFFEDMFSVMEGNIAPEIFDFTDDPKAGTQDSQSDTQRVMKDLKNLLEEIFGRVGMEAQQIKSLLASIEGLSVEEIIQSLQEAAEKKDAKKQS